MIQSLFDARKQRFVSLERPKSYFSRVLTDTKSASEVIAEGAGRLLAIDIGAKRVGVAVCDELRLTVRPVMTIERRSWKNLLEQIRRQVESFAAQALVIGLPLNMDGSEGPAALEMRRLAENFRRSLPVPIYLHDERLTTEEAKSQAASSDAVDAEAAAVILQDFLSRRQ